jgi:hypothetical protein
MAEDCRARMHERALREAQINKQGLALNEGTAYAEAGRYEVEIWKLIGYDSEKYRVPVVKIIQRALLSVAEARK